MPNLTEADQAILSQFQADPKSASLKNQVNYIFWRELTALVKAKLQESGKERDIFFTVPEQCFFDLGLLDQSLLDPDGGVKPEQLAGILGQAGYPENYYYFSVWLAKQFSLIRNYHRSTAIKNKIEELRREIVQNSTKIDALQQEREQVFGTEYKIALESRKRFATATYNRLVKQMAAARQADELFRSYHTTKRNIEGGSFLNTEEKRKYVNLGQQLEREKAAVESVIAELQENEPMNNIRSLNKQVEAAIMEILRLEKDIEKKQSELKKVEDETNQLTLMEIETQLTEIVDYNRDLVKLSARRVRCEPIGVLYSKHKPLSLQAIDKIMNAVLEFDPKLFKNERINITGRPSILLVPGYGNGIYDWKYNTLVIPTIPFSDPRISVFTAVVEYKLDCDEDKVLLNSYNQLEEYAGVRSIFSLKEKFVKDYLTFMNCETKGFKVLSKGIRQWFEREIAPSKINIKVPPALDPFYMSRNDFQARQEELMAKCAGESAGAAEHFALGTFYENQTQDGKALESFKAAVAKDPKYLDAVYNAAIMCLKLGHKKEAQEYLSKYIKLEPQSWWSAVCHEHLMKLR